MLTTSKPENCIINPGIELHSIPDVAPLREVKSIAKKIHQSCSWLDEEQITNLVVSSLSPTHLHVTLNGTIRSLSYPMGEIFVIETPIWLPLTISHPLNPRADLERIYRVDVSKKYDDVTIQDPAYGNHELILNVDNISNFTDTIRKAEAYATAVNDRSTQIGDDGVRQPLSIIPARIIPQKPEHNLPSLISIDGSSRKAASNKLLTAIGINTEETYALNPREKLSWMRKKTTWLGKQITKNCLDVDSVEKWIKSMQAQNLSNDDIQQIVDQHFAKTNNLALIRASRVLSARGEIMVRFKPKAMLNQRLIKSWPMRETITHFVKDKHDDVMRWNDSSAAAHRAESYLLHLANIGIFDQYTNGHKGINYLIADVLIGEKELSKLKQAGLPSTQLTRLMLLVTAFTPSYGSRDGKIMRLAFKEHVNEADRIRALSDCFGQIAHRPFFSLYGEGKILDEEDLKKARNAFKGLLSSSTLNKWKPDFEISSVVQLRNKALEQLAEIDLTSSPFSEKDLVGPLLILTLLGAFSSSCLGLLSIDAGSQQKRTGRQASPWVKTRDFMLQSPELAIYQLAEILDALLNSRMPHLLQQTVDVNARPTITSIDTETRATEALYNELVLPKKEGLANPVNESPKSVVGNAMLALALKGRESLHTIEQIEELIHKHHIYDRDFFEQLSPIWKDFDRGTHKIRNLKDQIEKKLTGG